jgi:replicative DNA helicase
VRRLAVRAVGVYPALAMSEAPEGRTPPRSEEVERCVLGAMLLDGERVPEVAEVVRAEDFGERRNQVLFATLVHMAESGFAIDFVSVAQALKARDAFHEIGGIDTLVELARSVTSSAHALHHARLVASNAVLRNLIREATGILSEAYETPSEPDAVRKLLDESEQRIFSVGHFEQGEGVGSIDEAITETFKRIDAASHRDGLPGLSTGFLDLDQKLCGLNAGDLIVVAARPSMGKTAFALNLVDHAALSQPTWLERRPVVLLFSLEMGRQQLVSRMLCSRARVDAHKLRSGRLPSGDRAKLADAADELRGAKIFIDDTSSLTMMSLRSRARRLKARAGLDLILVDYLQLVSFPRSESRQHEISAISRSLKALARELSIPVVALAQLSRQVELRDPPRPQLADLRESGSIEQDADVVMLLYRPEYYPKLRTNETRGLAEVVVAKQRNGPTGSVELAFFEEQMRFENRAPQATEVLSVGTLG